MIVLTQLTGAIIKCRGGLQDKWLKCSILFYCYVFYYPSIWYNNKIICLYFNCEGEASTSVPPCYKVVGLPYDGSNYRPKHVAVNVMNK